jgi:hypothetical protein
MFFGDVFPVSSLKKARHIVENIIWDFTPKQLLQPRCKVTDSPSSPRQDLSGYILYIETIGSTPALFLMIHQSSGFAETLAKIDGIPDELLSEAVRENKGKDCGGMYPINKTLEDWLKKEFGLQDQPS